jgi:hypothetical protein
MFLSATDLPSSRLVVGVDAEAEERGCGAGILVKEASIAGGKRIRSLIVRRLSSSRCTMDTLEFSRRPEWTVLAPGLVPPLLHAAPILAMSRCEQRNGAEKEFCFAPKSKGSFDGAPSLFIFYYRDSKTVQKGESQQYHATI